MNTIIFNEDARTMYKFIKEFDMSVRRKFIFDKFKIVFPYAFKAKVEFIDGTYVGKATIIGIEQEDKRETHTFSWNFRDYKYDVDTVTMEEADCYKFDKSGEADLMQIDSECACILSACDYIMNYKRNKVYKKATETNISSIKHNAVKSNSTVKKVYLFNEIVNYVREQECNSENKHNEITCPCWEVRGFYRHYKSGKVIWVNSFKKGKQRDKVEPKPKTYIAKER